MTVTITALEEDATLDQLINLRGGMENSIYAQEQVIGPVDPRQLAEARLRHGEWLPRGGPGILKKLKQVYTNDKGTFMVLGPPYALARMVRR